MAFPDTWVNLRICEGCMMLAANGEYEGDDDLGDTRALRAYERWNGYRITPADSADAHYGTTPCESCGDRLHGDRYPATAIPNDWRYSPNG